MYKGWFLEHSLKTLSCTYLRDAGGSHDDTTEYISDGIEAWLWHFVIFVEGRRGAIDGALPRSPGRGSVTLAGPETETRTCQCQSIGSGYDAS